MCGFVEDVLGITARKKAKKEAKRAQEEQRAAEEKRQRDIALGQEKIDSAFAQFDDGFFSNFRDTFLGTRNPDIDSQYGDAMDKLRAVLAGRGISDSTVAANEFAKLNETRDNARLQAANEADQSVSNLRQAIERDKTDLYALNKSTADPSGIEARAIGSATALTAPPASTPLGDLFASTLNSFGAFNERDRNSVSPVLPFNKTPQTYNSKFKVVG